MLQGEKISSLRKNKGISQEILAENSRVSLRTIQRIERGASIPRPYTLKMIAQALGVPPEHLASQPAEKQRVQMDAASLDKLQLINLTTLAAIIFPLSNILIPFFIWKKSKGFPLVGEIGRKIISFQILWTASAFFTLVSAQALLMGAEYNMIGRFPPTIIMVYVTLLLINSIFILRAAVALARGDHRIYTFTPVIF